MDELSGKQVPHNPMAEQSVVGAMLIDPRCIPDVIEKLKGSEFYIQQNRDIYETIYTMFSYGQTIDPVTVLDQMKARNVYRDNSREYIAELMSVTPTAANVLEYAEIVRDRALLRNLGEAADEISKIAHEGVDSGDTVLEAAERKIYALRQGRNVGGLVPVSAIVKTVCENLSKAAESDQSIPGISTGLTGLDNTILGLNKGELILIAARPGMGKTSIALNMAMDAAASTKKTVAVFSLEMSREQLVSRLLSSKAKVASQNMLTGKLNNAEWGLIIDAAQELSSYDMRIDDNPMLSVSDMNAQCRRLNNLGLVVIDYLQLMQSAGSESRSYSGENRQQVVSDMSRMLKIMAKELNIPVICLSQLSRNCENRPNKRPLLSDLRESGAIEQDADVVIALYRDGYYNKESQDPNLSEAIVLKNRKGKTGTVYMRWLPEFTSFGDASGRNENE